MATDGRSAAIVDTSVLVNFLAIDRADLLASHPDVRFVVADMVRDEVVKDRRFKNFPNSPLTPKGLRTKHLRQ